MPFTTVHLSSNNYLNTTISTREGEPLYWIETSAQHVFSSNATSIYKPSSSAADGRELVARFEPHRYGQDMISYQGKSWAVNAMFVKKTWPSRSRLVQTEAGSWKWSVSSGKPELFNTIPRRSLVRYHRNHHTFSRDEPILQIEDEALDFMDLVAIGWVVMMHDLRPSGVKHHHGGGVGGGGMSTVTLNSGTS